MSATPLIKEATNLKRLTKFLNTFDIEEKTAENFCLSYSNLTIRQKYVSDLDSSNHVRTF